MVGDHEDLMGGVAVLRDVTRQRDLEMKLSQSQKMEAIGRLAGGVAHDFNNLLVVIHSYAELLREELLDDDKRDDLDEILAAARRAAALTKQLLAFSRSEPVQPTDLRLSEVVTGIEKMLRRIIGESIELTTDIGPTVGVVRADAGQLDQVILNLSINARDAMAGGGKLNISTQNVSFDADQADTRTDMPPGEYVMLAVTDSGTGMTPETQRRIFEPFFTTKDVGQGTGLGLRHRLWNRSAKRRPDSRIQRARTRDRVQDLLSEVGRDPNPARPTISRSAHCDRERYVADCRRRLRPCAKLQCACCGPAATRCSRRDVPPRHAVFAPSMRRASICY